jgi:hypothetical protein
MSEAKIQIKIGEVEFSGEGEKAWVAAQLERILKVAPTIVAATPPLASRRAAAPSGDGSNHELAASAQPLATFLRDKNATNQVKRFLATAAWLQSKGKDRLTTADVTRALKGSNQSRLGNPADCLNKNVAKGHCEKDGKEFFVTTDGLSSL